MISPHVLAHLDVITFPETAAPLSGRSSKAWDELNRVNSAVKAHIKATQAIGFWQALSVDPLEVHQFYGLTFSPASAAMAELPKGRAASTFDPPFVANVRIQRLTLK